MTKGSKEREKQAMSSFFDSLAPSWDLNRGIPSEKLESLLSKAKIAPGEEILDVACGTGLIDPYLLSKGAFVTAIDISKGMIELAKKKKENAGVNYLLSDFYLYSPSKKFDAIICFDAYPHFKDKEAFAKKASSLLNKQGRLYIIHADSKENINSCHHDIATPSVSVSLHSPEVEANSFGKDFKIGAYEEAKDHYFLELIKL